MTEELEKFKRLLQAKESANPDVEKKAYNEYMQFLSLVGKQRINELWREIYGK